MLFTIYWIYPLTNWQFHHHWKPIFSAMLPLHSKLAASHGPIAGYWGMSSLHRKNHVSSIQNEPINHLYPFMTWSYLLVTYGIYIYIYIYIYVYVSFENQFLYHSSQVVTTVVSHLRVHWRKLRSWRHSWIRHKSVANFWAPYGHFLRIPSGND